MHIEFRKLIHLIAPKIALLTSFLDIISENIKFNLDFFFFTIDVFAFLKTLFLKYIILLVKNLMGSST